MIKKQLIKPHELLAMQEYMSTHKEISGGHMDIYNEWKNDTKKDVRDLNRWV